MTTRTTHRPGLRRTCTAVAGSLRARWRRVRRDGDQGGATVEFIIAVPALLLILLFVPQAAVWYHGTHVAQAAANRALDAAAALGGSATQGEDAGNATLTALGSGLLYDTHVTVVRTATDVRVDVTGTAETVVPGVHWTVHATATGPVERFVPDTGNPSALTSTGR
jgi:Flp pilus assembly protein TadG